VQRVHSGLLVPHDGDDVVLLARGRQHDGNLEEAGVVNLRGAGHLT
jgi:hypothetical protein